MSDLPSAALAAPAANLRQRYRQVRGFTETLCETLEPEDCCLQSMTDASPVRWHLAHTSWFFETFLLKADPDYRVRDDHYAVLFNSYYNTVGDQFPRSRRGLLSRPTVAEAFGYRRHVDEAVLSAFDAGRIDETGDGATIIEWGLHHEQQHQELILTDVKHLFAANPLLPAFREGGGPDGDAAPPVAWLDFDDGVYQIGFDGSGFAYDNEGPPHRVFLEPFQLASRPVTSCDYLQFIEDGGYERPELWLSDGWAQVRAEGWRAPIYWLERDGFWEEFTLAGARPLDLQAPVSHVSYYEADAYARWADARLPTEAEWEVAAEQAAMGGHFVDDLMRDQLAIHPRRAAAAGGGPAQMFGDVWEWTASPYTGYPGYRPPEGSLAEYNGKFMCNQFVLRGGSCATSSSHIRRTYRNFFAPSARWQFSGFRLARNSK